MSYAIGKKGGRPRYVTGYLPSEINSVVGSDEVLLNISGIPSVPQVISDDGLSLVDWVPPLEDQKDSKWKLALAYRNARQTGTCTTPLGVVQIDGDSKQNISGAVQLAMIAKSAGQPFSIDWTMADNSVVTHNADAMIALGVTVGEFIALCQNACTVIRDAITAATDTAGLDAIDIEAGYPN